MSIAEERTAFTAGPWHPGVFGVWAWPVAVLDQYGQLVATTGDLLKPWKECEANAVAIATLPDMYAALHAAILQAPGWRERAHRAIDKCDGKVSPP